MIVRDACPECRSRLVKQFKRTIFAARTGLASQKRKSSNRLLTCRPEASWKCPSSLNTANSCCNALAAIHMSLVGMGRTRRLSARYTPAYCARRAKILIRLHNSCQFQKSMTLQKWLRLVTKVRETALSQWLRISSPFITIPIPCKDQYY